MGLGELESLFGADAIEALDRSGLLEVQLDGRRQQVRLAHPLYGEVMRHAMPALTRRRLLLDGAQRVEAHGARRREDVLRIATARIEGAGWADPQLVTAAARLARHAHDFGLVDRLTKVVMADAPTPEAVLLRAEALHELGDYDEVEQLLAAGPDTHGENERLRRPVDRHAGAQPHVGVGPPGRRPRGRPGRSRRTHERRRRSMSSSPTKR